MAADRVLAIVQARMGSSRFPGKTQAPFAGATMLTHMLLRLRSSRHRLGLIVATTDRPEDDQVAQAATEIGVGVFRGSADDVLARFAGCVEISPERPDLVLRICADRPLLCPDLLDEMLDSYDEIGRPDYLANNIPLSYPRGLDLELVRRDCLLDAHRETSDPYDREHVTPFVYRRPERYRLANLTCPYGNYSHVNLSVDTRDDYERVLAVHRRVPADYDHRDVLNAIELEGL
jgi:spore coat polysaccharide biosynthesis protein SpsF